MSKFGRRIKQAPDGFEYLEPTLTALDNELRERVNEPHEGLRKTESQWPVHQINWQKSRYVYDMYYTFQRISREVYDYCIKNKIVDAPLIAKWKKPGYERLCSTYTINTRNYKFGTVSICRVPKQYLAPGTEIEDPTTGCRGCASGSGGQKNIFGNKYGQYLAAIQVAREERAAARHVREEGRKGDSDSENSSDDDDDDEKAEDDEENRVHPAEEEDGSDNDVVGAADGSSGRKASIWAADDEAAAVALPEEVMGYLDVDAEKEARAAAKALSKRPTSGGGESNKRPRM